MIEIEERINEYGEHRWLIKGTLVAHREDGPAIIKPGKYQAWCLHDKYHRIDGPAIMYNDGRKFWWVDGFVVDNNEDFRIQANISEEALLVMVLKYGNVGQ